MMDFHQLTIEEYTTRNQIDFSCFATYVTYPGAGCRSGECPHQENTDCRSCEAFRVFYETVEKYRNGERRLAECHYLAHKELGIPTAYDENGRIKNET